MIQDEVFQNLVDTIAAQQVLIANIANHLNQIESIGGGGGSASIEDYESGKTYTRNMLLVDTLTETVYRVIVPTYVSSSVEADKEAGYLKLVGFESQIVTMSHNPSQAEINALPDDTIVAVYNSNDSPYVPDT